MKSFPATLIILTALGAALAPFARAQASYTKPYVFTTLAGVSSFGSSDGTGSETRFNQPEGVAVDSAGNVYVADTGNHTIRKITPAGAVSTLAGKAGLKGSADGTGAAARFNFPISLAADAAGNIYVADSANHAIRKITPAGVVSTLAGLPGTLGSADGVGSAARFNQPEGLILDRAGNVYVADTGNHILRKITPNGAVSTLAGLAGSPDTIDGLGAAARFNAPHRLAIDSMDTLYVSEATGHFIRKVTSAGLVSSQHAFSNYFPSPAGMAFGETGAIFVADRLSNSIFRVDPGFGATRIGNGTTGGTDGLGQLASFSSPVGLAADAQGNLYVADRDNNAIRKISTRAEVTTIAGLNLTASFGSQDGQSANARFSLIGGLAADTAGNVYVADTGNHTVRRITPDGTVSTLAGVAGSPGYFNDDRSVARLSSPTRVAVDPSGNVYILERGSFAIRKISPAGFVSIFAGHISVSGSTDGPGSAARFGDSRDLATNAQGEVVVLGYDSVRRISPAGDVSTVTRNGWFSFFTNIWDIFSRGLTLDANGNIYLVGDHSVRRFPPGDQIPMVAGIPSWRRQSIYVNEPGSIDAGASAARFNGPRAIAVDPSGVMFVADTDNYTIRRVEPDGTVSTVAGLSGEFGADDGAGADARFFNPVGIAMGPNGTLYVADGTTVRKGVPAGPPVIITQPRSLAITTGNAVQFSATAAGAPTPTYQWFYNGAPFQGATQATLSFSNARLADAGEYYVIATNSQGSATSNKVVLTVTNAPVVNPPVTNPGTGTPSTPSTSSGGGAPSAWFLLALTGLATARWIQSRRQPA